MSEQRLKNILEAAMFAAQRPLALDDMTAMFEGRDWQPERKEIRAALAALAEEWQERGIELKEVASGFRFQVRKDYSDWLGNLWSERPPRYTRALMETLALIAYRQPITRGEIEDVRGVSVSPSIIKTLTDREWIRVLGHRDVPGRPELFGTTREFLDSFNLKSLDDLPPLSEIRDFENIPDDLFSSVPLMAVVEGPEPRAHDDAHDDAQDDAHGDGDSDVESGESGEDAEARTTASMDVDSRADGETTTSNAD